MEGTSVVRVLCVGQYNERGIFYKIQWKYFIQWCKLQCNKIVVYSRMTYNIISYKFPLYCDINSLEKPDESLNVYAYEIIVTNAVFWEYIKDYNYDINIPDVISHIFFFYGSRYVASLEIVDYENYILIEDPIMQVERLLVNKNMILENIQLCLKGKADLDGLLQEESWKPLGSV